VFNPLDFNKPFDVVSTSISTRFRQAQPNGFDKHFNKLSAVLNPAIPCIVQLTSLMQNSVQNSTLLLSTPSFDRLCVQLRAADEPAGFNKHLEKTKIEVSSITSGTII
jgi:hypothetical protein